MDISQLRIRAFRTTKDIISCEQYIQGHIKVLASYGITKVTSLNKDWQSDPNSYVIIVESFDRSIIYGGGRIQIRSENIKLPMEDAIFAIDKNIYSYVDRIGNYNVAEFCGLWNSREVAGYGIGSIILGRVGVAITSQLHLKNLMALCSPATLNNCKKIGFEVVEELGNKGTFYYPKEDLIATALIIKNIENLEEADPKDRSLIFDLRRHPKQKSVEKGPKGIIDISYNIDLS